MRCKYCGDNEITDDKPFAELNIRLFKNSETTDRVYEYIKICLDCANSLIGWCIASPS